ncbi:MAG: DUF1570 domain-containing protein, partial [Opitutaceae bacterium]|nr:DUF1570 domain-containing protein [Opitutaceae bacterium]
FLVCAGATAHAAQKWIKLSSEHFDLFSCTSEGDSRQLLVELEQFREFFFTVIPQGRVYDAKPAIFIFDTQKQYSPYQILTPDGKERPNIGVYMGGPLQARIMLLNHNIEQGLSTIFHEYVHSLAHARMGTKIPAWFNEGLAEVYETFSVSRDTVIFGKAHEGHVRALRTTPMIPLGTLFSVDHKSPYYNEREKMNIFYSQSWALIHYAMLGTNNEPYTMKNILRFVDVISRPNSVYTEAFAKIFGTDYKQLEKALGAYLRAGKYTQMTTKIPMKPIAGKITVTPMTDGERDIELAGLLWRSRKALAAEVALFQLMEQYPENPRPYEIFAEIKMAEREKSSVTDYLRKAVDKKSTNPMVYTWLLRNYYSGSNQPPGYMMPDDMAAEYTALVDRALELAPDCMEAYEMLAIIESQRASIRVKKMNAVLEALISMRERGRTCLALATVYWRLKRYDDAESALKVLSADPKSTYDIKRRARDLERRIAKETGREVPPPLPRPPKQRQPFTLPFGEK